MYNITSQMWKKTLWNKLCFPTFLQRFTPRINLSSIQSVNTISIFGSYQHPTSYCANSDDKHTAKISHQCTLQPLHKPNPKLCACISCRLLILWRKKCNDRHLWHYRIPQKISHQDSLSATSLYYKFSSHDTAVLSSADIKCLCLKANI